MAEMLLSIKRVKVNSLVAMPVHCIQQLVIDGGTLIFVFE